MSARDLFFVQSGADGVVRPAKYFAKLQLRLRPTGLALRLLCEEGNWEIL